MDTLGLTHMVFGIVALLAGTAVVLRRKGTRWHRTLGHVYLTSMIGLNVTAFFIYDLYGHFGPFHWLAVSSVLTLLAGMVPVFMRRPVGRWLEWHATFITMSFIGLVAATAAEITSRIPGTEGAFGLVVGGTSAAIIGAGALLMRRSLPGSMRRTPHQVRQTSQTEPAHR
jgi:uncharacterized membrane protein